MAMGTMLMKYTPAFTPPRESERAARSAHTRLGGKSEKVKVPQPRGAQLSSQRFMCACKRFICARRAAHRRT